MNDHSVSFDPALESLVEIARRATAHAAREARGTIYATELKAPPITALEAAAAGLRAGTHTMFFYSSADRRESFFGFGATRSFSSSKDDRFVAASRWWNDVRRATAQGVPEADWPMALGGFAFSSELHGRWRHFPAALWILPTVLIAERGGESTLVLSGTSDGTSASAPDLLEEILRALCASSSPPEPPSHPDGGMRPEEFRSLVRSAQASVVAGEFEKVVLARSAILSPGSNDQAARALQHLSDQQPGCRIFAMARRGEAFLGAAPERLVRVLDRTALVDCLAGTSARGTDPWTDDRLASDLLTSAKNRAEHDHVVRDVAAGLRSIGLAPEIPERPGILRLSGVQHLHTPVRSGLPEDMGLIEVAAALHPTPAVGGRPRTEALHWLSAHGALERGWYSGAVGWVDARGEGELSVALRSALLADGAWELYAGCGIVAGSDPDAEYQETELKLQPMLRALEVQP